MFIFGGLAAETFASGGPGAAIVQLMLLAAFGSLGAAITSAVGQKQISGFIRMMTIFACLSLVINQIVKAISAVARGFGVPL